MLCTFLREGIPLLLIFVSRRHPVPSLGSRTSCTEDGSSDAHEADMIGVLGHLC